MKVCLRTSLLLFVLAPGWPAVAQEARWNELNAQVRQLYGDDKYTEALPLAQESLRVASATYGSDDLHTGVSTGFLGLVYHRLGKYADAEPLLQRAVTIYEKVRGPEHAEVATALSDLAELYEDEAKYAPAEALYRRALAIDEKIYGNDDPEIGEDLSNLATVLEDESRFEDAEALYRRTLAIDEKALDPNDPRIAINLDNLGSILSDTGRYSEAERSFERAIAINEEAFGPDDLHLDPPLNNLGELYREEGKYGEAELLLRRSIAICEKALGPDHPDLAANLDNLASVYMDQGKYADAEALFRRALAIREKALGPNHPDVATSLNNLASLYQEQGRYKEAEPLFIRALHIREDALGLDHPDVAQSLSNLVSLAVDAGLYAAAEPLQERVVAILEKSVGPDHPAMGSALSILASLQQEQHKYTEAEQLFLRALQITQHALGPLHPDAATDLNNLAILYDAQNKSADAEKAYDLGLQVLAKEFDYNFSYMSEKDRLEFLATLDYRFNLYFSFVFRRREQEANLPGKMYDVLLWKKGVVASIAAATQAKVLASGDKEALQLFADLTAKKSELARLAFASADADTDAQKLAGRNARVEQLQRETNELESALARRSESLGKEKASAHVSWQQVRDGLHPDDAAVEFIRFPLADADGDWTGASYYAALVLRKESSQPGFVVLGKAKDLEAAPMEDYRGLVRRTNGQPSRGIGVKQQATANGPAATGRQFMVAYWQPLEEHLKGAKRVYVAPDGALNQVSFGVMPTASGALMEAYDLRTVNSTKDVLRQPTPAATKTAVLFGNPNFGASEAQERAALKAYAKATTLPAAASSLPTAEKNQHSRGLTGGDLPALPGTQAEVDALKSLFAEHDWNVDEYTQTQALEGRVKQVKGPRVLHLATHGFFLEDEAQTPNKHKVIGAQQHRALEDPMLRSGLFLAGADHVLSGSAPSADLDDGVLSAYEATQLNLQGTELVVLSACETGLGETQNGEGVFGLRRALQEAGAGAILMSMWSVPDQETRELMQFFYTHWLNGEEKHAALRAAELEEREQVKKRYGSDLPYYWGAFVLVGQ